MKKTDREKDWPMVHGLGRQLSEHGQAWELLHLHRPETLLEAWRRTAPEVRERMAERRKHFYRDWRRGPDWEWPTGEPFLHQHQRLLAAARAHGLPATLWPEHPPKRWSRPRWEKYAK